MKVITFYSFLPFIFLVLLSPVSSSDSSSDFIRCLSRFSLNPTSISKLIYTPNNSSYTSLLNFSINNLRFATPSTPKPSVIVTPTDKSQVQTVILCSRRYGMQIRIRFRGHDKSASTFHGIMSNTTLPFSSIVGPQEEISMFGHQLSYVAPCVYGIPQALVIHWQIYADKMVLSLSVDPNVIPDPRKLRSDIEASLQLIKNEAIQIKS